MPTENSSAVEKSCEETECNFFSVLITPSEHAALALSSHQEVNVLSTHASSSLVVRDTVGYFEVNTMLVQELQTLLFVI